MGETISWSAFYDSDGYIYYHNDVSGETTWNAPAKFNPPPPSEEEELDIPHDEGGYDMINQAVHQRQAYDNARKADLGHQPMIGNHAYQSVASDIDDPYHSNSMNLKRNNQHDFDRQPPLHMEAHMNAPNLSSSAIHQLPSTSDDMSNEACPWVVRCDSEKHGSDNDKPSEEEPGIIVSSQQKNISLRQSHPSSAAVQHLSKKTSCKPLGPYAIASQYPEPANVPRFLLQDRMNNKNPQHYSQNSQNTEPTTDCSAKSDSLKAKLGNKVRRQNATTLTTEKKIIKVSSKNNKKDGWDFVDTISSKKAKAPKQASVDMVEEQSAKAKVTTGTTSKMARKKKITTDSLTQPSPIDSEIVKQIAKFSTSNKNEEQSEASSRLDTQHKSKTMGKVRHSTKSSSKQKHSDNFSENSIHTNELSSSNKKYSHDMHKPNKSAVNINPASKASHKESKEKNIQKDCCVHTTSDSSDKVSELSSSIKSNPFKFVEQLQHSIAKESKNISTSMRNPGRTSMPPSKASEESFHKTPDRKQSKVVGCRHGLRAGESLLRKRRQFASNSIDYDAISVDCKEEIAHKETVRNPFVLMVMSMITAIKTFLYYLVTLEVVITSIISAGLTVFWYYETTEKMAWHTSMNFILVCFSIVAPISASIFIAFGRRERALEQLASFRSVSHHLYMAHSLWDWKSDGGRAAVTDFDFEEHCDGVLEQLIAIGDELARFLALPTWSRGQHRLTSVGRKEASRNIEVAYRLLDSMTTQRVARLSVYAERLKMIGLCGSEISRIRQHERNLSCFIEQLRMLKMHRTPQALWAFAKIGSFFLPPLYASTFAEIAKETHSLGMGICFAVITSVVLAALLEIAQVMEDPFVSSKSLDGIDIRDELEVVHWAQLVNSRRLLFPDSKEYPAKRFAVLSPTPKKHECFLDEELGSTDAMTEQDLGTMGFFAGPTARSRRQLRH